MRKMITLLLGAFIHFACTADKISPAITAAIPIIEIKGYGNYPQQVRELIITAQNLSQQNLTYLYGSASPNKGGMDCSGTIQYLLKQHQINEVPRSSNAIFDWVKRVGRLYSVTTQDFNSEEFSKLKSGDLLFWSGTYRTLQSESISHIMLYLGKNKKGERLMFGASNGRTYQGKKMWGVSVFDFKLPKDGAPQRFEGYSCVPKLTCEPR